LIINLTKLALILLPLTQKYIKNYAIYCKKFIEQLTILL
jgi:hypothetical protein